MFKKFFMKMEEEEEEVVHNVDPIVEQRRKEKFSTPLIYNEEVEVVEEKKPEIKKTIEKIEKKAPPKVESTYKMSEIISPMSGVKKSNEVKKPVTTVSKPVVKKVKKETDALIPIISPFYGPSTYQEVEEPVKEPVRKVKKEVKKEVEKPVEVVKEKKTEEISVENNLRNIASIVKEEQDQLRIIEERTGEFKLDFSSKTENTFIDEIDDSMSLDELMSLYEKKFKD